MTTKNAEFTASDRTELIRLLAKMVTHIRSHRDPRQLDFLPDGVFETLHGINSMWAPELVITRETENHHEVLLARYDGGVKEFAGIWNLPGGYNRFSEIDINSTIQRIAAREISLPVKFESVIGAIKWRPSDKHPYGRPLSLFVRCTAQSIEESDSMRFFPINCLPPKICVVHRRFLLGYFVTQ